MAKFLKQQDIQRKIEAGTVEVTEVPGEKMVDTYKKFDNGYVGYSQERNGEAWLDMFIHDLPNGDILTRSHEIGTSTEEPDDYFSLKLNNFDNDNCHEIERISSGTIIDNEYDNENGLIRSRNYVLMSDTYYNGQNYEDYNNAGNFESAQIGEKQYDDFESYKKDVGELLKWSYSNK